MAVRLFVGNLPYDTTEAALRELFAPAGPLTYIHFPMDRETGRPRGFAFVEFAERSQAEEAIRRFNNQLFKDRPLAVNEARARDAAPPPRTGPPSRPYVPRPSWSPEPEEGELKPGRASAPSRSFGPDAVPKHKRKFAEKERTPKVQPKERFERLLNLDEDDDDDTFRGDNFAIGLDESGEDDE